MWLSTGLPEPSPSRSEGFTLIEVLIAFAILAVALVALFQAFGAGSRSIETSERYLTATMLARSVLDDIGSETPIAAGERSDDIGNGYRWTIRTAPSPSIAPIKDRDRIQVPYVVQVEIAWNGRPITTLTTLRLVAQKEGAAGAAP